MEQVISIQHQSKRWGMAVLLGLIISIVPILGKAFAASSSQQAVPQTTYLQTYNFSAYLPWNSEYPWTSATRKTQSIQPDEYTNSISPSSQNGVPMAHVVTLNHTSSFHSLYTGQFVSWNTGSNSSGRSINLIIGGKLNTFTNITVNGFWAS